MRTLRFSIFFICLTLGCNVHSQTQHANIDSLIIKSKTFKKTNLDSALFYANQASVLALQTGEITTIAQTNIITSSYLINSGSFEEATKSLQYNLDHSVLISGEGELLGATYYNMGAIAHQEEKRDAAISYYLKAVNAFPEEDYNSISRAYLGVGAAYGTIGMTEHSNYFYDKSLEFSKKSKDNPHTGKMSLVSQTDRIKNCLYLLDGLDNKETSRVAMTIYADLGEAYFHKKKYDSAVIFSKLSLNVAKQIGFAINNDDCNLIVANSQFELRDYKNAINSYREILKQTSKPNIKKQILFNLTRAHKNLAQYQKALTASEAYAKISDSVKSLQENERIAEITVQYETEKQANEILVLQQENQEQELLLSKKQTNLWKWSLFAFLATAVSIFLGRNLVSSLKRIKKVEEEKREIAKKVEETAIVLNNKTKVYLNELKYIKSDGNYLEFVTVERTVIDRNKLKDILKKLPPNFVRVHRSYVINKNFIAALNSTSLLLNSNIEIPLSRTFKTNLA